MPLQPNVPCSATRALAALASALLLAVVAACGGGGGSSSGSGSTANDVDPNRYSVAASASLATPNENTAVTHGSLTLAGAPIAYTATAGHLTANDGTGTAEASFFYVAYTQDVPAAAPPRPLTVFFNGGPGSASAWLHLGSWAPKRVVTGEPATTATPPFPYVDNTESLIDTSDLVFVDAIGTGLSEAISPHKNQDFWGVDVDGAVFRDFVTRYLAVNNRSDSKLFIYGESYGTVRAPVLARLLETAGVPVAGVVLQSAIVNYASNCSIELPSPPTVSCAGELPTYAAVGAYFDLVAGRSRPTSTPSSRRCARSPTRPTRRRRCNGWTTARPRRRRSTATCPTSSPTPASPRRIGTSNTTWTTTPSATTWSPGRCWASTTGAWPR